MESFAHVCKVLKPGLRNASGALPGVKLSASRLVLVFVVLLFRALTMALGSGLRVGFRLGGLRVRFRRIGMLRSIGMLRCIRMLGGVGVGLGFGRIHMLGGIGMGLGF